MLNTPPLTSTNTPPQFLRIQTTPNKAIPLSFESLIDTSQLKSPTGSHEGISPTKSLCMYDSSFAVSGSQETVEHRRSMSSSSLLLPPFELDEMGYSSLGHQSEVEKMETVETADTLLCLARVGPTVIVDKAVVVHPGSYRARLNPDHSQSEISHEVSHPTPTEKNQDKPGSSTVENKSGKFQKKKMVQESTKSVKESVSVPRGKRTRQHEEEEDSRKKKVVLKVNSKTPKETTKDNNTTKVGKTMDKQASPVEEDLPKTPKQRRRERNRLAARKSRERKLLLIEGLQKENQELRDRLEALEDENQDLFSKLESV